MPNFNSFLIADSSKLSLDLISKIKLLKALFTSIFKSLSPSLYLVIYYLKRSLKRLLKRPFIQLLNLLL